MTAARKYPHNVLEGFGNGALLDLRVRLAMQILTHSPTLNIVHPDRLRDDESLLHAREVANMVLNLANELLSQAEARGWIEPLPDLPEIDGPLKDQAMRTAEYQARQQVHGNGVAQKIMQEDAPKVIPMVGGRH